MLSSVDCSFCLSCLPQITWAKINRIMEGGIYFSVSIFLLYFSLKISHICHITKSWFHHKALVIVVTLHKLWMEEAFRGKSSQHGSGAFCIWRCWCVLTDKTGNNWIFHEFPGKVREGFGLRVQWKGKNTIMNNLF